MSTLNFETLLRGAGVIQWCDVIQGIKSMDRPATTPLTAKSYKSYRVKIVKSEYSCTCTMVQNIYNINKNI